MNIQFAGSNQHVAVVVNQTAADIGIAFGFPICISIFESSGVDFIVGVVVNRRVGVGIQASGKEVSSDVPVSVEAVADQPVYESVIRYFYGVIDKVEFVFSDRTGVGSIG